MKKYLIEKLKALRQLFVSKSLPTSAELFEKSRVYAYEECVLQNFHDENEIMCIRGRYIDGYEQAIRDFVKKNYKGL